MSRLLRMGEIVADRYEITGMLGQGSAAHVYAARDKKAKRGVAIKVMRVAMLKDSAARKRFAREAELQAKLRHRNIAAVYDSGLMKRKEPYIVIELLRGKSLRDILRSGKPIAFQPALSYCWQALSGLAAMHEAGILHRDLKPGNLMLEPSPGPVDRVVLIDFGFASLEGGGRITATGHVVGSLGYLAPERLLGEAADARSDIYSLGVILFELICGRRPFVADHDLALVNAHLKTPVPKIADVTPGVEVPDAIEDIIHAAMSKEPSGRFATAEAMAKAIEDVAQE